MKEWKDKHIDSVNSCGQLQAQQVNKQLSLSVTIPILKSPNLHDLQNNITKTTCVDHFVKMARVHSIAHACMRTRKHTCIRSF